MVSILKGSILGRYTVIFLVFLQSGSLHAIAEFGSGRDWAQSGVLRYFVTQFYGILVEDAAQEITKRSSLRLPQSYRRCFGFLWLVLFQIWSVPAWIYPELVQNKGGPEEQMLPFSFIKAIKNL